MRSVLGPLASLAPAFLPAVALLLGTCSRPLSRSETGGRILLGEDGGPLASPLRVRAEESSSTRQRAGGPHAHRLPPAARSLWPHSPVLELQEAGDGVSQENGFSEGKKTGQTCALVRNRNKTPLFSPPIVLAPSETEQPNVPWGSPQHPCEQMVQRSSGLFALAGQASRAPRAGWPRGRTGTLSVPHCRTGSPASPEAPGRPALFSTHACLLWLLVLNTTWCPKVAAVPEKAPGSGCPKVKASCVENPSLGSPGGPLTKSPIQPP